MFKGVARSAVYIILSVPLIVIAILITRQLQAAFNVRNAFIENEKFPYRDVQQVMATNELSTRSFFLIFICFLMILCGILIILNGTENALNSTKEVIVRSSLKSAYPGLLMAVIGCMLLAYSIYKSSELQFNTSSQLVRLNEYVAENNIKPNPETLNNQESLKDDTPIQEKVAKIPNNGMEDSKKEETKQPQTEIAPINNKSKKAQPLTDQEINWANQLAINAIAFGYTPNKKDNDQYESIIQKLRNDNSVKKVNANLQWAFSLLQKTKKGYQPSAEELDKYESVIAKSINGNENKLSSN